MVETSWETEKGGTGERDYAALSYTWGSPKPQAKIEIDGRPFYITQNLDLALRHLRLRRKELKLWADSICINQEDVEERNQHVRQMREIYSAAKETTIFIGEATEGSDVLFNAILDAKYQISIAKTKNEVVKSIRKASGLNRKELIELALHVLWRPYWKRMWVFQEIVVSHNPWVQCGTAKVPWEDLCQSLIAILDVFSKTWGSGYGNEPQRRLEDMYWERRAYRHAQGYGQSPPRWDIASGHEFEGRMKLLDLLVTKRGSEASDSRDMVFALAGIAEKPKNWDPLTITYEKSPALVYMGVVKYLLDHDGSYEVLSQAGPNYHNSNEKHKLPTWVPDWRFKSHPSRKIVDWVPPLPSSKNFVQSNHIFLEEYGILVCIGNKFETVFSIGDTVEEIKPPPDSLDRVTWDNKWYRRKMIEHGVLSDPSTKLGTVNQLFTHSHPLTYERKLAKTKGGILCLVPRETEVGDAICQFTGSRVPFILRPLKAEDWKQEGPSVWSKFAGKLKSWLFGSDSSDSYPDIINTAISEGLHAENIENDCLLIQHYKFIGECYVDGLMSGIAPGKEERKIAFALH